MIKTLGRLLAVTCLSAYLSACGNAPVIEPPSMPTTHYGAFVGMGPVPETQLAKEAVAQLTRVYPPGVTLLKFQQNIDLTDGFGQQLMRAAQRSGYFVRYQSARDIPPQCDKKPGRRNGLKIVSVCYIVDDVASLLRLTLFAGGKSWNRLFTEQENALHPAGAWTQMGE